MKDEKVDISDEIREYYKHKTTCPKCGSKNIAETFINLVEIPKGNTYIDLQNKTVCSDCGWTGIVDSLKG